MNQVVIALGSNIDKERNMRLAVAMLREMTRVTAVSPVYETEPVGLLDQPTFFNAAVLIHTALDPATIKAEIIGTIERALHRVREADPNAPRTIDADIVLFNDVEMDYPGEDGRLRHVPDKDLLRFPHVAVPVANLLPDMRHPETGERLQTIAERLLQQLPTNGRPPLWPRLDVHL